jgi:outer membrane protein TolC
MISATGVGAFGDDAMIFAGGVDPRPYLIAAADPIGIGSIMAMWKIYSGGRERTAAEIAKSLVAQGDAQLAVARLNVLRDVRVAYAEALAAQGELAARMSGVKAAAELLRVTEQRFQAGSAPEAFVLKAKADMARAERQRAMAEAALLSAIAMLKEAAGMEQSEALIPNTWDSPLDTPQNLAAAIVQAKAQRPEIQAAVARKRSLELRSRSARQSAYPELNVMAMGTGVATESGTDMFYKVGLVVSVPIVDGGMRRSEAAEMKAKEQSVEHEIRALGLQISREVASAWASWEASPEALRAAGAEVASAQEAYRIALLRYTEGKAPQVEVEQAAADLVTALGGRAEANAFRQIAWSNLMRAVGEKTDQEDQTND